ncbi:MAG: class I SAM-dependent methyltransferase [Peptococcaceae bacterium]|jgi:hypothetical protein|nr:class I SAM-dependent methyltransferase [Peptococcaceae bacterium]
MDGDNPWNRIKARDYDLHMGNVNVAQLKMLGLIIKEQLTLIQEEARPGSECAILGITNGNGLEHVDSMKIGKVIGIDINQLFLDECLQRYGYLGDRLKLARVDLIKDKKSAIEQLKGSDLIIANLMIEHVHMDNFIEILRGLPKRNRVVSCVIQYNPDGTIASKSGYEHTFDEIMPTVEEADESDVVQSMLISGYNLELRKEYPLPNGKIFIRLDFYFEIFSFSNSKR